MPHTAQCALLKPSYTPKLKLHTPRRHRPHHRYLLWKAHRRAAGFKLVATDYVATEEEEAAEQAALQADKAAAKQAKKEKMRQEAAQRRERLKKDKGDGKSSQKQASRR